MKYLVDTCVISELVAPRPSAAVVTWLDRQDAEAIYLSVITVGEIRKGIEKLAESRRKTTLRTWLNEELLVRFKDHLLPIDVDVMLTWGQLAARLDAAGHPMPAIDTLVAAFALTGDLALVTRNEADFRHAGVRLLNPWKAAAGA